MQWDGHELQSGGPVSVIVAVSMLWASRAFADDVAAPTSPAPAPCAAFDATALTTAISQARDALFADDLAKIDSINGEIAAGVSCLDAPVTPEAWAPHLVTMAVVAFGRKDDWQVALASALQADPRVDRAVGEGHPIRTWALATTPAATRPAPETAMVYVDGRRVRFLPALYGPHLVQVARGSSLRSTLLLDGKGEGEWDALVGPAPVASAGLEPPPRPVVSPAVKGRRTLGWTAFGGGMAATVAGGVWVFGTGIEASTGTTTRGEWDGLVASNSAGWSLFYVGLAATGVGVWGIASAPHAVSVGVGPAGMVLSVAL